MLVTAEGVSGEEMLEKLAKVRYICTEVLYMDIESLTRNPHA